MGGRLPKGIEVITLSFSDLVNCLLDTLFYLMNEMVFSEGVLLTAETTQVHFSL